ncbi:15969_t:CDS:2 [Acaulospora morrowiae]|uniref:15969_t:CDS:1 n=1 Tax=Acaulospora morrowiae TaxID=94023 RepID=A0A9N9GNX0_9GLOM|nr:15969_t:CDS:2 [Acaulospora morrowiae]
MSELDSKEYVISINDEGSARDRISINGEDSARDRISIDDEGSSRDRISIDNEGSAQERISNNYVHSKKIITNTNSEDYDQSICVWKAVEYEKGVPKLTIYDSFDLTYLTSYWRLERVSNCKHILLIIDRDTPYDLGRLQNIESLSEGQNWIKYLDEPEDESEPSPSPEEYNRIDLLSYRNEILETIENT